MTKPALLLALLAAACVAFLPAPSRAEDGRALLARAVVAAPDAERDALITALASGEPQPELKPLLLAWQRGQISLYKASASPAALPVPVILADETDAEGKAAALRVDDGTPLLDAAGKPLRFAAADLPAAPVDMRLRGLVQQVLDVAALGAADPEVRLRSAAKLGMSGRPLFLPALRAREAKEDDLRVLRAVRTAIAQIGLGSPDPAVAAASARALDVLSDIGALDALKAVAADASRPAPVRAAAQKAVKGITGHVGFVDLCGTLFRGLSLGSVLLIVALGLAITFGLMGIINMAHGEMVAVGAYTCYVVQNLFGEGFGFHITLPVNVGGQQLAFGLQLPGLHASGGLYQAYFLFAIPLSFLAAAAVGFVLERLVIRFLYARPLESLLATWGVSLFLQQGFRMVFGANNVQVDSPAWLLGNVTLDDVVFNDNRLFVIAFAVLIVFGTWLLLTKTPLGLLIRAVMQNRTMAACVGVRTARVNSLTFAFGSGLAGLAGAFLSQIGNVGPSMGQNYIVDSFMTVVVGGVGNIVGTIVAALGMGAVDQFLQQLLGSPVMGKILVLVAIILFLQWRPGGFFPSRSRSLDE